jgi:L-Ala-D/L-Glu epimerase
VSEFLLTEIEIRRLDLPLTVPYRLSFGVQIRYDSVLVILHDAEGREGFGEATLLPGYTEETGDDSWRTASELATCAAQQQTAAFEAVLAERLPVAPFTVTAFVTALEQLRDHPRLSTPGRVPLLAIVQARADDPAALEQEIETLLARGYTTLKVKVGWEVADDLAFVRRVRSLTGDRARLRIDANQGYSRDQALAFVDGLDPEGIELLEQPCAADDWASPPLIRARSPVPLMLDESIYSMADIRRAAERGAADCIKLKLMKLGSLDRLTEALALIRELGMTPVLGNGAAGDVGCWMEACAAPGSIDNAGEMNGFLKTPVRLLDPPLRLDGAELVLDGQPRRLDPVALEEVTVQRQRFTVRRS